MPFFEAVSSIDKQSEDNFGKISVYEYGEPFWFEKYSIGKEEDIRLLFEKYKWHSLVISALYVGAIYTIKNVMKTLRPFSLRLPLILWSATLAVFSIMGAVRSVPEFLYVVRTHGLHYSLCHPSYFYGVSGFWSILFTLSKVWELGDTFFIVMKKQNLIFLHWYHHWTVLVYCFFSYAEHTAPGRWFYVMNYVVHSIMYSYYTLRAMRFRVPRILAMSITALQIVQMVVGSAIFIYVASTCYGKTGAAFCQISGWNIVYGALMYLSYLLLFAQFFHATYLKKPKVEEVKANGHHHHSSKQSVNRKRE